MYIQNTHKIVLDSSAWIEYLKGSKRGESVEKHISGKEPIMCTYNLMEVLVHARKTQADDEEILRKTLQQVAMLPVSTELATNASRLYTEAMKKKKKFSYGDALGLMTADELGAPFLTCDNDFSGMKHAIVVR